MIKEVHKIYYAWNQICLKDMIDFYLLLKQNGTMFFNGLAGNSQYHFHFHYIQEPLPIEAYINDSVINKQEKYKTISGNDVYLFKTNSLKKCFRGILITGKKKGGRRYF